MFILKMLKFYSFLLQREVYRGLALKKTKIDILISVKFYFWV